MFGQEVSEPVDLVAGLPLDSDTDCPAPEYVQNLRERLELAHEIARDALGESVKRAKRQYDKNCCHTQYQIGDAVWYLIKGTKKVKNKVRKFLPSYEGPYFILGKLDDLVYRIQQGPKTKVKVVHHNQLKPYRSRDPLYSSWVMEQAQRWTPTEVSPPTLDVDPADPGLGLSQLFTSAEGALSCPSADSTVNIPEAAASLSTFLPVDCASPAQASGGGVASQSQRSQRPNRQRRSPVRYGEWATH